ncbi:hypothetical protein [Cyanobacterium sp. Dongsha4]|uniref:hypothetical protein n=1 Tax=Cyanobacterium sp. DS4 TaxID=2878255 RepID=UPI002E813559|nr:hypothetical protein [Cyanobacterium sp. Dongsha4]WVK99952.1 hypothetical protein Dongsha4_14980 [Cyanobacterium sp. Dongsha4]
MSSYQHQLFYIIFLLSSFSTSLASANTIFDDESSCNCAEDLSINNDLFVSNKNSRVNIFFDDKIKENTSYFASENQEKIEENSNVIPDLNKWRFQFQPYVTVPINTYGTATARGRSVDYHLSLGEMLDALNFTASARFEAWKGRFGVIFDGYYVNLGDVANLQKQTTRTPSALNAVNYLMSQATNTRVTELANNLDRKIETAKQDAQLKESEIVQQLDQQIDDLKNTLTQDLDRIEAIDAKISEIKIELTDFSNSRTGEFNIENLEKVKSLTDSLNELLALNPQDSPEIVNLKQLSQTITEVNGLSTISRIKVDLTKTIDTLGNTIQKVRQEEEVIQRLNLGIDKLRIATAEDLQRIKDIDAKIALIKNDLARFSDSRIGDINLQDLQDLKLRVEGFRELLALNVRDFPEIQDLQALNEKISDIGILSTIPEIKQELIETRNILEEGLQRVKQEREIKDTDELQQLEREIQSAKTLVDEELAKIQKTEDFLENRIPQNLDVTSQTNLNFQQGIYDFALSYHFGDIPNNRLPDKPSGRNYPLMWFQPIAGVRLNNISINIEQTINVVATSSLVNFNGSFQNNYGQTRTWFEPMLGAKMGLQLSDRIALWLRGDASGFGLAGETDMSWNLLGGMDWWVGYNTSLQLGYRFYEIDYSWGSGNNKFGFKESFNGPFLSATFHF